MTYPVKATNGLAGWCPTCQLIRHVYVQVENNERLTCCVTCQRVLSRVVDVGICQKCGGQLGGMLHAQRTAKPSVYSGDFDAPVYVRDLTRAKCRDCGAIMVVS